MKQLTFPFMNEEQKSAVDDLVYYDNPKDINQALLNLQYRYLHGEKNALAELWQLSQVCCEAIIERMKKEKNFYLTAEEKRDKALDATEYVLRRYSTTPGYVIKKSFVSQLRGGVMHALWYGTRKGADALDDAVDLDVYADSLLFEQGEENGES